MYTNRPQRLRGVSYLGCSRYFLTFCTNFRAPLFVKPDVVELVWAQFLRAANEQQFSVLAYCFMPDHAHFLVHGNSEASDARRLIKSGNQYSGYAFSMAYGRKLWQPWGYEHVLRDDESTRAVARYIVENPVRAGLVKTVLDYTYVGSQVCE